MIWGVWHYQQGFHAHFNEGSAAFKQVTRNLTKNQKFSKILFACFQVKAEALKRYLTHFLSAIFREQKIISWSLPVHLFQKSGQVCTNVTFLSIENNHRKNFTPKSNLPLKALWMVQIKSFDLSAAPPETMTSLWGGMPTVTCFCRTSKSVTAFDKSSTLLPRKPERIVNCIKEQKIHFPTFLDLRYHYLDGFLYLNKHVKF